MDFLCYNQFINWRTRPGVRKPDLTTLFRDRDVLGNLINDLAGPFMDRDIDVVMGPESLGFALGCAVAFKIGAGFVPVRKGGRLPTIRKFIMRVFFVDYTGETQVFEIGRNVLPRQARVLIVDDWIDTGGQVKGILKLATRQHARVVGISCLAAHMTRRTRALSRNLELHAIMPYDDEDAVKAIMRDNEEKDQSLLYQEHHRFQ